MNRQAEKFFDAITLLREDLVEEAQNYVFQKKRSGWKKFGSLAACVMLVLSLGMLTILPKGCGAGGSDSSGNTSGAPMEAPPASNEVPPPSGSSDAGNSSDSAPRPPVGNNEPGQGSGPGSPAEVRFMGQVSEILEEGLLIEPFNDYLAVAGALYVPTEGLEDLPEFYPGAVVEVVCGEVTGGTAEGVTEVWLLEP